MSGRPARGYPDWGTPPYSGASLSPDVAQSVEYSALGFARIDGGGRIITTDTWANGLSGWRSAAFAPATLPRVYGSLGQFPQFTGPSMLRLFPAAGSNNESSTFRELSVGQSTRLGIEFAIVAAPNAGTLRAAVDYRTLTGARYFMRLQYDGFSGEWAVLTPGGPLVVTTRAAANLTTYQQAKIVGDWETGEYVRAIIGDRRFDLAGLQMFASGMTEDARVIISLSARQNSNGGGQSLGIGYIVFSIDEA